MNVIVLSVILLSVIMPSFVMLSVIMLSIIMLSVIMLSVIMLSVVPPLITAVKDLQDRFKSYFQVPVSSSNHDHSYKILFLA